ncbi:MAG TPA: hypothetical protein VIH90_01500 [Candidatus Saccharimonadales bacterium]
MFNDLLQQKMTRKQFIIRLSAALVALFGISSVLGALTKGTDSNKVDKGYGSSNYGP